MCLFYNQDYLYHYNTYIDWVSTRWCAGQYLLQLTERKRGSCWLLSLKQKCWLRIMPISRYLLHTFLSGDTSSFSWAPCFYYRSISMVSIWAQTLTTYWIWQFVRLSLGAVVQDLLRQHNCDSTEICPLLLCHCPDNRKALAQVDPNSRLHDHLFIP